MSTDAPLTVRAIDVGYGHIKYTTGRHRNSIITQAIPSLSPVVSGANGAFHDALMQERDTFRVPVCNHFHEVGRDASLVLGVNQITEVLDNDFPLSDHYAARLLGAINYMMPLPNDRIDVLVLGLPLTTFARHREALARRFEGEIVIDAKARKVTVGSCHVYPQPLGSYMAYLATRPVEKNPQVLCIDPGYNTFDWFVCQGMSALPACSGAVKRGMGAVMRAIADEMIRANGFGEDPHELIRLIDQSLMNRNPLKVYGREYRLEDYIRAGDAVIEEAAQAVRDSVGDGKSISAIVIAGGGASMYEASIRGKCPHHELTVLSKPAHANARGFHILGEIIAESLHRAHGHTTR
ncbi:MAG: PRTRC system protein D [Zoogloeaceae bacterium]|nr:PRTRC system protein D [Zoogloeaceae bacterium]